LPAFGLSALAAALAAATRSAAADGFVAVVELWARNTVGAARPVPALLVFPPVTPVLAVEGVGFSRLTAAAVAGRLCTEAAFTRLLVEEAVLLVVEEAGRGTRAAEEVELALEGARVGAVTAGFLETPEAGRTLLMAPRFLSDSVGFDFSASFAEPFSLTTLLLGSVGSGLLIGTFLTSWLCPVFGVLARRFLAADVGGPTLLVAADETGTTLADVVLVPAAGLMGSTCSGERGRVGVAGVTSRSGTVDPAAAPSPNSWLLTSSCWHGSRNPIAAAGEGKVGVRLSIAE